MTLEEKLCRLFDAAESVYQSVIIKMGDSKCIIKYHEGILPCKIHNHKLYVYDCLSNKWNNYDIDSIISIEMMMI